MHDINNSVDIIHKFTQINDFGGLVSKNIFTFLIFYLKLNFTSIIYRFICLWVLFIIIEYKALIKLPNMLKIFLLNT